MNVIKTTIEGVVVIEPKVFKDSRGYFVESFSQREFDEKVAIPQYGKPILITLSIGIHQSIPRLSSLMEMPPSACGA